MTAMIETLGAQATELGHAGHPPVVVPARREGPAAVEPGEAAGELDAEVTRLLRVRRGELAEPLLWGRPSHRRAVDEFVGQLAPIRSRIALLSSWERESRRGPALRLAYALVWLRLAQRRASEFGPRLRSRPAARRMSLTGRG